MEYRPLGRSNIQVSSVGLGVMTFGAQTKEKDAFAQLDIAFEAGITLYDTAENYPAPVQADTQGRSEELLGKWIKSRNVRDQVVIATKVAGPGNGAGDMRHLRGSDRCLNSANIDAAVKASLRRLNTDVIDLYQVHWPERPITTLRRSRYSHIPDTPALVPIEETLGALADQVQAGNVREIGVCNESPWGVMHYLALAEQRGLPRIASIQNSYSLLDRLFEGGLAEIALREDVGLIAYSPLASGLLTGKYANASPIAGSRSSLFDGFESRFKKPVLDAMQHYIELAKGFDVSPSALALGFCQQQAFVTSVLIAASNAAQLQENLKNLDISFTKEMLKAINQIHDQHPNP